MGPGIGSGIKLGKFLGVGVWATNGARVNIKPIGVGIRAIPIGVKVRARVWGGLA